MSVSRAYGKAFFELAAAENTEDAVLSELKAIAELFGKQPEYIKILDSPRIRREERIKILDEDFSGKIHRYTLNFMKLLAEKREARLFSRCLAEFEKLYNEYANVRSVKVTTARPISEELLKKLAEKLREKDGGKIVLKCEIDESRIGGIIIETDGRRIDLSLKTKLSELKQAISG